jgi:hypothetical protein
MFILIILILFLAGAVLPLAIESLFSSDELIEMGVYLPDLQSMPATRSDQLSCSQNDPLYPCAGLPA